jgi:hypothetical protein
VIFPPLPPPPVPPSVTLPGSVLPELPPVSPEGAGCFSITVTTVFVPPPLSDDEPHPAAAMAAVSAPMTQRVLMPYLPLECPCPGLNTALPIRRMRSIKQ